MIKKIKANIPNAITCLNLLSGCVACIFAFHSQDSFEVFKGYELKGYELVYILIGAAAIFDFFDGAAARLLHATSNIGKELDSLSDLISFGVAPAMLMYNTMTFHNEASYSAYAALAIAVFGAIRLARFNVDDRQTDTFIGLPIPANAIFWIGASALIYKYGYPGDTTVIIALIIMSLLMVAPIKMYSLKFHNLNLKENIKRYIIILAAILFVIFFGICGLAYEIALYILLSVFSRKNIK